MKQKTIWFILLFARYCGTCMKASLILKDYYYRKYVSILKYVVMKKQYRTFDNIKNQ
jgi:hypothetical protein